MHTWKDGGNICNLAITVVAHKVVRLSHRVLIGNLLQSSCYGLISQQYSRHCYVASVTQNTQGEQWQFIHSDVECCINQTHVMSLSTAATGFDV